MSSPDVNNVSVIFTGHDMVTDAGRTTTCRVKVRGPSLPTKCTKMKDLSKTWVLTGKQFEDLRQKKEQKHYSRPFKKNQWSTRPLNTAIEYDPCNQAELNGRKLEKSIQIKTVGTFARLKLRCQVLT